MYIATSRYLYDDASPPAKIKALAITTTGNSESFRPVGDCFGIAILVSAYTSGTLTPTLEWSPDNGSNWFPYPDDFNSQTQAGMSDITATGKHSEFYKNFLPPGKGPGRDSTDEFDPIMRLVLGGSSPNLTLSAWLTDRNFG